MSFSTFTLKFGLVFWRELFFLTFLKLFHLFLSSTLLLWSPMLFEFLILHIDLCFPLEAFRIFGLFLEFCNFTKNYVISPLIYFIGGLMGLFNLETHAFCDFLVLF